jgi:hypothetical protein
MKNAIKALGVAAVLGVGAQQGYGAVVISEIMFNPAGSFDGTADRTSEWAEIYNTGPAAEDISGWRLDDEDSNFGAIAAGTTLAPGQVAVIFDSRFISEGAFRTEWSVPAEALVLGVTFQSLGNTPSTQGEDLTIVDAGSNVVDAAFYDNGLGGWPSAANGRSIYATVLTTAGNDAGANWLQSAVGIDGAHNPTGPTFAVADVGSPGLVPIPEPTSLALLGLGGLPLLARRRRRAASTA